MRLDIAGYVVLGVLLVIGTLALCRLFQQRMKMTAMEGLVAAVGTLLHNQRMQDIAAGGDIEAAPGDVEMVPKQHCEFVIISNNNNCQ